jgi:SAM-dependent methyltransferase
MLVGVSTSSSFCCPVCGGCETEPLFAANDRLEIAAEPVEIRKCRGCGLGVTWPPTDDDDLGRFYPDGYWGEGAEPTDEWLRRSQREKTDIVDRVAPAGGRLMDVGCGSGFFLRALDPKRWDRSGVEISERSAAAADRALGGDCVLAGRLDDVSLPSLPFDVVTFWASLEHVATPRQDLDRARSLLSAGGIVVVQVPDFYSWQAVRFGPDWFALDVPRHRWHFGEAQLSTLLDQCGFRIEEMLTRSVTHDPHALKQSLKTRLVGASAPFGRTRYYAAAPFVKLALRLTGGATLTAVARAV